MKQPFKTNASGNPIIDIANIQYISRAQDCNKIGLSFCSYSSIAKSRFVYYEDQQERNEDYNKIKKLIFLNKKETKGIKTNMLDSVKNFYKKHEDILFPLLVLVALDYFFNDGRFQKKIALAIEGIVDRVINKVTPKKLTGNTNE
jgi:hypothetical protein